MKGAEGDEFVEHNRNFSITKSLVRESKDNLTLLEGCSLSPYPQQGMKQDLAIIDLTDESSEDKFYNTTDFSKSSTIINIISEVDGWQCPICTYIHLDSSSSFLQCEVCGTPRLRDAQQYSSIICTDTSVKKTFSSSTVLTPSSEKGSNKKSTTPSTASVSKRSHHKVTDVYSQDKRSKNFAAPSPNTREITESSAISTTISTSLSNVTAGKEKNERLSLTDWLHKK